MADKNIQMKNHNGTSWDMLFPITKGQLTIMQNGVTLTDKLASMDSSIDGKVTKVTGKSLSTNDFTNSYKNKLEGLNNVSVGKTQPTTGVWFEEI